MRGGVLVDLGGWWGDFAFMQNSSHFTGDSLLRFDQRHWRARAEAIALKSEAAEEDATAEVLREALLLMTLAPKYAGVDEQVMPDPLRIEAMLGCRAYESAALALYPANVAYMVSRGSGDGPHFASVMLPGMAEEVTMQGAGAALALVAALLTALAGGVTQSDDDEDDDAPLDGPHNAADPLDLSPHWLN